MTPKQDANSSILWGYASHVSCLSIYHTRKPELITDLYKVHINTVWKERVGPSRGRKRALDSIDEGKRIQIGDFTLKGYG